MHISPTDCTHRDEALLLHVYSFATCESPKSTRTILEKKGPTRRSALRLVGDNFPIVPSVQATTSTYPDASVSVRLDAVDGGTGQTLLLGQRGNCKPSKAIEAALCGYPNIPLPVFKDF